MTDLTQITVEDAMNSATLKAMEEKYEIEIPIETTVAKLIDTMGDRILELDQMCNRMADDSGMLANELADHEKRREEEGQWREKAIALSLEVNDLRQAVSTLVVQQLKALNNAQK